MPQDPTEKRTEPRRIVDQFYSVEFSIGDCFIAYQFRIWNMSREGMCLLVKEGSNVLRHLKVGDVIDMKYYNMELVRPAQYLKTKIEHITKSNEIRYLGHYLVGISILDAPDFEK